MTGSWKAGGVATGASRVVLYTGEIVMPLGYTQLNEQLNPEPENEADTDTQDPEAATDADESGDD